jgi:Ca2+-transporting ATPase
MTEGNGLRYRGLTAAEAARRLQADGPNELPRPRRQGPLQIALEVLREPMFRLLLAAGVIYLLLGDLGEALLLLAFAGVSVGISIWQSIRSENALEALRELGSPRAQVIRDGELRRIPGREVVNGDIVVLGEGDRVPADLRLLYARELQTDESLLTGESLPAGKRAGEDAIPNENAITAPGCAYSGTLVVRGDGVGEVFATGVATEIGKIGHMLQSVGSEVSPLQRQTRGLVRLLATAGLVVSALVVLIHGLWRDGWLEGLLAGTALAMAMLPEEFPLVLTVFLTLGAWRLARQNVLTRRQAAVEALGATTVLCTDKTGTLTRNRMSVTELATADATATLDGSALPAALARLLSVAVLASKPEAVDPMDRALRDTLAAQPDIAPPPAEERIVQEYGLTPELPAYALLWRTGDGALRLAAKGAPETVAALCGLDEAGRARMREGIEAMAARGIRVLAAAECEWPQERPPPASLRDAPLQYRGLLGFSDPLRAGVSDAIAECRAAGVRVLMITGDHPLTARAIAAQAGLDTRGGVLTGAEIDALDAGALGRRLEQTDICARISPAQKLRIVEAFKAAGEVVAMTGDGVNDAPSLRAAHIGVAMGGRGSDVAREAAALVLLDDDFSTLVSAVRQGRRIYDNLRKAMAYILAVHVPIAGLSLLPLLFGWPLILTPIHIVFLELLIDPVCSIVFEAEPEEPGLMRRPPRDPHEPLISRRVLAWALLQGLCAFACVTALYLYGLHIGLSDGARLALAFTGLVVANVALIFANRSFSVAAIGTLGRHNRALWRVLGAALTILLLALFLPPLRKLFGFELPELPLLLLAPAAGLTMLALLDLAKRVIAPLSRPVA